MKRLRLIMLCLISFNAHAEEICQGPRADKIKIIEDNFYNCDLDFPDNNTSNLVMINVTQDKINCLKNVADNIFETFYTSNKEEKHNQFTHFVENVLEQSHNLEMGSDLGKHWHTSSFYELGYINHAYVLIRNMVKDYINYMKQECEELPDTTITELQNFEKQSKTN